MLYVMCKWLKLAFNKINASQLVTRKSQNMKINVLLFFVLFSFVFQFQEAQSQDEQGTHTFKIVGSKKNLLRMELDLLSMTRRVIITWL